MHSLVEVVPSQLVGTILEIRMQVLRILGEVLKLNQDEPFQAVGMYTRFGGFEVGVDEAACIQAWWPWVDVDKVLPLRRAPVRPFDIALLRFAGASSLVPQQIGAGICWGRGWSPYIAASG